MESASGISPRSRARLAGLFQALEGFPAAFGQVVVIGTLVSSGDPAVTAHNILANETLYRLGFLIPLAAVGFHIMWTLLMYQLFVPVNRTIALLATFVMLVGCAIQALAALVYLAPLVILQPASSLSNFDTSQLQSLALVFANLSTATFQVYLIFFGLWCVLTGYLIFKSTFLPRILGALLVLDGVAWMTFLWAPFAIAIYPAIEAVSALAEIPLLLWFVIFGVNNQKWYAQVRG
ncbi:MAG: DUF4386 domain-containing protein [Chloroflexi bacterium]|nr:DUF4386 domain-containing protein [Chloroflexota bacterium]